MADQRTPWLELRVIRQRSGQTITSLALASGLSKPYVSQLESGAREANPRVTDLLAKALDVPAYVLTKGEPERDEIPA